MDGPYWILASREGADGNVLLSCVQDRSSPETVHQELVSLEHLAQEVYRFARQVNAACERQGFESRDLEALRGLLPFLR